MSTYKIIITILVSFSLCLITTPSYSFMLVYPEILPGENRQLQVVGSSVKMKGLTDQQNKIMINDREVGVGKDGSFNKDLIIPLGDTEIIVIVVDKENKKKIYTKKLTAKENYFFMVGLADGTLNFSSTNDGESITWERDSKHFHDGFHVDGKLSYYLVGKVLGRFLIKSSLDTDKTTKEKLFTYIDPDKYYPIYGDDSTVVYDAHSQGKLYVLLEYDRCGAVFGNYQTQIEDEDAKLTSYNRTLYGGKLYIETPRRTIYGEPYTKASFFLAEANHHAGHSEFLATGGSLYYLRHRNLVEGSEQVRIDVRDKNTGMTIYSTPMQPKIDYEIKHDEGRIMFKSPISTVAASDTLISQSVLGGNPVYIVVNYEYENQEAFPITLEDFDNRTGGLRISQYLFDNIKFGLTYVREEKDENVENTDYEDYMLRGFDTTIRLGNFTKATLEFAQSRKDTTPLYLSYTGGYDFTEVDPADNVTGNAWRLAFNSCLGEFLGYGREFLDMSGYYQRIGDQFVITDGLYEAGTIKYGMELAHKLTDNDKMRFIYEKKELENLDNRAAQNEARARKAKSFTSQWSHNQGPWTFITEHMYRDRTDPQRTTEVPRRKRKEHSLAERIQYEISKYTSVFIGEQVDYDDSHNLDHRAITGFKSTAFKDISISAEAALGDEDNSVSCALQRSIDKDTTAYINHTFANSSTEGKTSTTSFGSNTVIGKNAKLTTERQFITSDQRENYMANLMGLDWQITPRLDFSTTYQRRSEEMDPNLIEVVPEDTVTTNLSYVLPDRVKASSKGEFRRDTDNTWQVLSDTHVEYKLFNDIFLFGEYEYSLGERKDVGEDSHSKYSKIDKKQVGLAYRPVRFDWFNLLFKYMRFIDERPKGVNNADGGFLKVRSKSDVWAIEGALDLPWNLQFVEKFAYKDEHTLSYDILGIVKTPDDLEAWLLIHRLNYHLTNKWDAACEYRFLNQKGADVKHWEGGLLFEVTYSVLKNVAIGAGFNLTSFDDDILITDHDAKGFFLRLQGRY